MTPTDFQRLPPPELTPQPYSKAKLPITDIAFSQDGDMFAIASEDCRVYIHDAKDYSIRAICSKVHVYICKILVEC